MKAAYLLLPFIFSLTSCASYLSFEPASADPIIPEKIVKVMVVDTGVDINHPMLAGRVIAYGQDAVDPHGHGTHVTGLILYGNSLQFPPARPLCREVEIYHCRYHFKDDTEALTKTVNCFKKAADMKMDYVNYSAGGAEYSQKEYESLKKITDYGGVIVVAAGNESSDITKKPYYPAGYRLKGLPIQVISNGTDLAHKNHSTNWASFSIWRNGTNRYSTMPDGAYGYMTGTSQAAPIYLHGLLEDYCNKIHYEKVVKTGHR